MPFAVEMYFDEKTDGFVRHIWRTIATAGFKSPMLAAGYAPHISLGVYDKDAVALDDMAHTLNSFARSLPPFPLVLSTVGSFSTPEDVIFLGATVTQQLQWIHASFHAAFEKFAGDLRPYYRINRWAPHCTLSYHLTPAEIAAILELCWQTPLPLNAQVEKIGIAKVSPISCQLLVQLDLQNPGFSLIGNSIGRKWL